MLRKPALMMTMLLLVAFRLASNAGGEVLVPASGLAVDPSLSVQDKEATNVSGLACDMKDGSALSCLLVGDEVRYARFFSIASGKLRPGKPLYLLPELDQEGRKFNETDAEGIAYAGGYYYVIGSHGLNKSGKHQPSRYFLYRVKVDESSGVPDDYGSSSKASTVVEKTTSISSLLSKDGTLSQHTAQKPGEGGVNIEGLAINRDRLFIGFRGPIVGNGAIVADVPVSGAFAGHDLAAKMYTVDLGAGQGVRDLVAIDRGVLILSGPQERVPGEAGIFLWRPGSKPDRVADLGTFDNDVGQPEALLVLSQSGGNLKLLVMQDGPVNGAPKVYDVSLPQMK
jgi:hypothetical protein